MALIRATNCSHAAARMHGSATGLMEMAQTEGVICASAALIDGGPRRAFQDAVRRPIVAAFVIRYDGKVYGTSTVCAHIPVGSTGWRASSSIKLGITCCARHGATYQPATVIASWVRARVPPHCGEVEERDGQRLFSRTGCNLSNRSLRTPHHVCARHALPAL